MKSLHYIIRSSSMDMLYSFGTIELQIKLRANVTCDWSVTRSTSSRHLWGNGFDTRLKLRIKVKICTYCCYVSCALLIIKVEGMPWHKTDTTHYHSQLGLPINVIVRPIILTVTVDMKGHNLFTWSKMLICLLGTILNPVGHSLTLN